MRFRRRTRTDSAESGSNPASAVKAFDSRCAAAEAFAFFMGVGPVATASNHPVTRLRAHLASVPDVYGVPRYSTGCSSGGRNSK